MPPPPAPQQDGYYDLLSDTLDSWPDLHLASTSYWLYAAWFGKLLVLQINTFRCVSDLAYLPRVNEKQVPPRTQSTSRRSFDANLGTA